MEEKKYNQVHIPAFSEEEIKRQELSTELDAESSDIESSISNEDVPSEKHVDPNVVQEILGQTYPSSQ